MYVSVTDVRDVDQMTMPELIRELGWDLPRDKCIALFFELQHEHGLRTTGMLEGTIKLFAKKDVEKALDRKQKGRRRLPPPSEARPALAKTGSNAARPMVHRPAKTEVTAGLDDDEEAGDAAED